MTTERGPFPKVPAALLGCISHVALVPKTVLDNYEPSLNQPVPVAK